MFKGDHHCCCKRQKEISKTEAVRSFQDVPQPPSVDGAQASVDAHSGCLPCGYSACQAPGQRLGFEQEREQEHTCAATSQRPQQQQPDAPCASWLKTEGRWKKHKIGVDGDTSDSSSSVASVRSASVSGVDCLSKAVVVDTATVLDDTSSDSKLTTSSSSSR